MTASLITFSSLHFAPTEGDYALFNGVTYNSAAGVSAGLATDANDIEVADVLVGILIKNDGVLKYILEGVVVHSETLTVFEYYASNFIVEMATERGFSLVEYAGRATDATITMRHEFYNLNTASNEMELAVASSTYIYETTLSWPLVFAVINSGFVPELYAYEYPIFWCSPRTAGTTVIDRQLVYDAGALSLFDRMDVQPTVPLKAKQNAFITGLKAAGHWYKLDYLLVSIIGETGQAQLLDWMANRTATNSGCTFDERGFVSANISYIESNFDLATDRVHATASDHCAFAWVSDTPIWTSAGTPRVWTTAASQISLDLGNNYLSPNATGRANTVNLTPVPVNPVVGGELYAVTRNGGATALYKGGTIIASNGSTPAQAFTSDTIKIAKVLSNTAELCIGIYGFGSRLTQSEIVSLKSLIEAYIA
jgi:hypothetical protein